MEQKRNEHDERIQKGMTYRGILPLKKEFMQKKIFKEDVALINYDETYVLLRVAGTDCYVLARGPMSVSDESLVVESIIGSLDIMHGFDNDSFQKELEKADTDGKRGWATALCNGIKRDTLILMKKLWDDARTEGERQTSV